MNNKPFYKHRNRKKQRTKMPNVRRRIRLGGRMKRLTGRFENGRAYRHRDVIPAEAIQKLAEYEDMEEQGLLVRLPCKVGDTVYDISEFVERTPCPEMYEFHDDYIGIGKSDDGRTVISIDCMDYYMDDFGRIVFTSREAAEKALEEVCRKNT